MDASKVHMCIHVYTESIFASVAESGSVGQIAHVPVCNNICDNRELCYFHTATYTETPSCHLDSFRGYCRTTTTTRLVSRVLTSKPCVSIFDDGGQWASLVSLSPTPPSFTSIVFRDRLRHPFFHSKSPSADMATSEGQVKMENKQSIRVSGELKPKLSVSRLDVLENQAAGSGSDGEEARRPANDDTGD